MASNSSLALSLKTRLQIGILSIIVDASRRSNITVNRRLYNFLDRKIPPDPKPHHSVSTSDVPVDPSRNLWFRLFLPSTTTTTTTTPLPVVIFFHGGGFCFLSADSFPYDSVCRRLSRRLNSVIVSVNYRLAPEHKFPAQYDDAFDILRFLNDNHKTIPSFPPNADIKKCFLAGDSAGGNIAHHTAVRFSSNPLSDLKILGSIIIQPFFGGEDRLESEIRLEGAPVVSLARTEWMWKAFFPDGVGPDHWASNVSGPSAMDISGLELAPTMVVVGGFDPLKDWQRRYFDWLKKNGKEAKLVEYPNACHAFYVFPDVIEGSALFHEIKDFMDKQLERGDTNFGLL